MCETCQADPCVCPPGTVIDEGMPRWATEMSQSFQTTLESLQASLSSLVEQQTRPADQPRQDPPQDPPATPQDPLAAPNAGQAGGSPAQGVPPVVPDGRQADHGKMANRRGVATVSAASLLRRLFG